MHSEKNYHAKSDQRAGEIVQLPPQPRVLRKIIYKDQDKHIAEFPILSERPIIAGFSYGSGSRNMSVSWDTNQDIPRQHTAAFLAALGVELPPRAALIDPVDAGTNILEVTEDMIEKHAQSQSGKKYPSELALKANFIFTRSPRIAVLVKPGDCPTSVIHAIDGQGQPIVGVGHWGRNELEHDMATKVIDNLRENGCDVDAITIAFSPAIAKAHYYIQEGDQKRLLPNIQNWGLRQESRTILNNEGKSEKRIYLDLLGYTFDQLMRKGIPPEHIEAYGIDTFEAAKRGKTFSHRYATSTNQPKNNGRFIVAAQLAA